MTMTALKTWANGDPLLYTEVNSYIGSGGNLSHMFAELASGGGQLIYSTGSKAVAVLAAGTAGRFLRSGGTAAPTWAVPAASELGNTRRAIVYRNAVQSISNASFQAVNFDTETSDPDAWHDLVSNTSRLTIPASTAGVVHLIAQVTFAGNATGVRGAAIVKGGATYLSQKYSNNVGASTVAVVDTHAVDVAAAGDFYELHVYQNSGGALDASPTTGRDHTFLHAILMPGTG